MSNYRLLLLLLGFLGGLVTATAQDADEVDIPFERFVLDNGLRLIVHEDHKAPIVAVNVWYHVGSKNEKPGKTGFAHLFEHLMFNGSENYDADWFLPFQRVGATDMNGTTFFDRTNYFQNVPNTAVDLALFLESDRMGHLLGAITQEKLDEQRGVVQNEKRQGENQPYGKVFQMLLKNVFPEGHPYSWETIGSMDDLDAASLEDVQEWFKTYYGPNNAVLVIAGDIKAKDALAKVEKYFGDIPPGPPLASQQKWVPMHSGTRRETMQDRVPQARVYKAWATPQWGTEASTQLGLVSSLLAGDKNSRLYKRLVYEDQIATDVGAFPVDGEISGIFVVWATAQPGGDLSAVETAMDEELTRFIDKGPSKKELQRIKTQNRSGFIRGVERIGGFGGKSDILAKNEVYGSDAGFYQVTVDRVARAKPNELRDVAREWLSDGQYVLEVLPYPEDLKAADSGADRSELPFPSDFPGARFPGLQRGKLSNGLDLVVVTRSTIPVINFSLLLDAGYAADQFGIPGTASLAMNMLDEGTDSRNALEIAEELSLLGATLAAGSNLDTSSVTMSALKENLDESLDIYADVILNPSFPGNEFTRLQRQQLAGIQREKVTPVSMALRTFPKLLYGEGHAYALPLTGSGTEQSVLSLDTEALREFHTTWFKPNNGTMIVVGDTTLDEISPRLEQLFRDWPTGDVPKKNIATVQQKNSSSVYLVDRPGSEQSIIFAGNIAPPRANPNEIAIQAMNDVLGGNFSARINMNLREDKHWSYGARSLLVNAQGQRPFIVYAPVQSDKTRESMAEIQKELQGIIGDAPPTVDEVSKVKARSTLSLPGRWETAGAIAGSVSEIVRFGLPDDYWNSYADQVSAMNVATVTAAAHEVVHPGKLVWVVVGDRAKIEQGVRELGLGDISLIDADGNLLSDEASVAVQH